MTSDPKTVVPGRIAVRPGAGAVGDQLPDGNPMFKTAKPPHYHSILIGKFLPGRGMVAHWQQWREANNESTTATSLELD